MPADGDRPVPDVVEAVHQRRDARLPRTRRPHQRNRFTRVHPERDVFEHRYLRLVPERDIPKLDRAVDVFKVDCVWLVHHVRRHIEELVDSLARRHRALHDAVVHCQMPDRLEEPLHVQYESDHDADLERAVQDEIAADDHHDRHRQARQRVHGRQQRRPVAGSRRVGVQAGADLLFVLPVVQLLPCHALDHSHARQILVERCVCQRNRAPGPDEGRPRPGQPEHPHEDERRHDDQREYAQPPVQYEQHGRDAHERHDVAQRLDADLKELLQSADVALYARHHPTHFDAVRERKTDPLKMPEHVAAQVE